MDLIDAYYMVAADLKERGDSLLWQAESLAQVADRMCEQRIRDKPLDARPADPVNG